MPDLLRPRRLVWIAAASLFVSAACAGGSAPAALTPADLQALEAQRAQHPDDPALNLKLAEAYYAANRFADARRALHVVLTAQPANERAQTYLGLTYEGLQQFDSARTVYTRLLASKPSGDTRRLLSGRVAILTHKELQYRARQAIARESLLTRTPPDPNTVAVMPFRYTGADTSLRPLERGLAALVVTDLSHVRRLRIVERDQIQALLDEMKLAATSRVDPGTGARSGRLIGAGQVVQGQFTEVPTANFRVDATVVRATDAQVAATGSGSDRLQALFDIEKQVVFQLLDRLNITLSPGERTAISERPTRDIQAFLLYSRGLEAQDRGDFGAAAQSFQQATQRDPGFSAAQQGMQTNQAAQTASGTSGGDLAGAVGGGGGGGGAPAPGPGGGGGAALGNAINNVVPTGAGQSLAQTSISGSSQTGINATLPPTDPNRVCEATATCGTTAGLIGYLILIIPRP